MIETLRMQVLKSRELSALALRCCQMTFFAFVLAEFPGKLPGVY